VPLADFANAKSRNTWVDDKGLMVFSLWSPAHPGTEVDLFVEEPFDFDEAWERRMDAVLPDGTTVHVVGFAEAAKRARRVSPGASAASVGSEK